MSDNDPHRPLLDNLDSLAHVPIYADASRRAVERARAAAVSALARSPRATPVVSLRRLMATAAVLAAVGLLAVWFGPPRATEGVAFAEVLEEVGKAKTVQYVLTSKTSIEGKLAGPLEMRKVMILGRYRKREEVKTTAGDPLPKGHVWTTANSDCIMIVNAETAAQVTLFPAAKIYRVEHPIFSTGPNTQEGKGRAIKPNLKVDFYKLFAHSMQLYPAEKATKVPNRVIGGKTAAGFQFVEKIERSGATETWTRTYWVDPKTKLPVRNEVQFRSTDPMMVDTDWVESDIVFDAPLDVALFSTDPPAGYHEAVPNRPAGEAK